MLLGGVEVTDAAMKEVAKSKGIEPLQLGPALCGALASGVDVYYDGLHASWDGHEILAEELTKSVLRRLDKQ